MSLETKANGDLYDLIEALAGTSDFTDDEKTMLLSLANQRMYKAYREIDHWPRYLVAYEPRTAENQIIPYTEDAFYVFGAGTSGVDGLYVLNGQHNSCPAYTLYDETDGTTEEYSLIRNSTDSGDADDSRWIIIAGAPDATETVLYENTSSGQTVVADGLSANAVIDETNWSVDTGTANAPQVRDLSNIGSYLRIWRSKPFFNDSAVEYDFTVQADGAHVLNIVSTTDTILWATYKKRLTLLTEWDEGGTNGTSEVPIEFFYYIAHGTYADFLNMDGQTSKAMAQDMVADKWLQNEIEDPAVYMNQNTIKQRIRTHVSQQSR